MKQEDLLHKLQELEKSLQSVNSAAGEVEKTVKAYADLGIKINSYTNELENINKQINQLCDAVNSNYSLRLKGMDKRLDELSAKFVQSVNQADSTLQTTVADFDHKATSTTTSLADVAEQTKVDLRRLSNDISNAFSERCDNAIASFKNAADAVHNDMDRLISSVNSTIGDSQRQLSELRQELLDENKKSRKLSYCTMILVAVSIILALGSFIVCLFS